MNVPACLHIQCHCGPSSQNVLLHLLQPTLAQSDTYDYLLRFTNNLIARVAKVLTVHERCNNVTTIAAYRRILVRILP